ncbi:PREDICTED: RING-H2 finger protein ATL13-like [Camelina sativa]|uniref:RING-type E3 ubiquitin transferase n=1 Tax=Camelina sativa TaxID=90675 RepID=A0ABM0UXC9_CAMSA|nr:PREDICTED: RING-H2 finger protein ATL13-like [Camelina sativa]
MKFSRENMFPEIKTTLSYLSPSSLPRPPPPLEPSLSLRSNGNFDLNSKISPSILLIIIILSIIFFISGLLHLLVRFLLTPSSRDREDYFDNVTALQGQLQQLFHLHDSGVDQSFIDTLPVFHYKSIIGLKNYPFDCAVCLCEFETEDKLRLLPKCSHAFHMDCIDTWLLSHSTCPLCRSSLLSDLSPHNQDPRSSFLLVLESASDHSSREIGDGGAACVSANDDNDVSNAHSHSNSHMSFVGNNDLGLTRVDSGRDPDGEMGGLVGKVVPFAVKLGKFRNIDIGEGSNSNNNIGNSSSTLDERRCFSMGSYEYIMDEETALKVHVSTKKPSSKNPRLPGHRTVMSECGFDPTGRLKFNGSGSMRIAEEGTTKKNVVERESFSVSKIWLRGKKEKHSKVQGKEDGSLVSSSSGRTFSFGLSNQRNPPDAKVDSGCEEDNQKRENSESLETKTPSFARRTMLWLAGRQNKVVHSSSPSNV